ncbi:Rv3654c family TadE-like protein [Skermania piniformis]|uniref:Rv3654c family TadE-like protein n=1 Tax=Skermania pinensis TaxID=39122 RepID=UPI000A9329C7|nr:Rv3654c family TadE-like protein [Skermania piniformis]
MSGQPLRLRSDQGVATVIACVAIAVILIVTILVVQVGAGVALRHRAQSAADLGALAAAAALDQGDEAACAVATRLVDRVGVRVRRCSPQGWDIVLEVGIAAALGPFGRREVRAVARAGPVPE